MVTGTKSVYRKRAACISRALKDPSFGPSDNRPAGGKAKIRLRIQEWRTGSKKAIRLFGLAALLIGIPTWLMHQTLQKAKLNEPLIAAVSKGNIDEVGDLIDCGADVNTRLFQEKTVRFTDLINILLHRKIEDIREPTVLICALLSYESTKNDNYKQIAEMLINNGADVNAKWQPIGEENYDLISPLMLATATEGNIDLVQLLLDKGADVNATNRNGLTALMLAVGESQSEKVNLLLDHGANPNAKTSFGLTALKNARHVNPEEKTHILWILKRAGANE